MATALVGFSFDLTAAFFKRHRPQHHYVRISERQFNRPPPRCHSFSILRVHLEQQWGQQNKMSSQ
jgi:hypothetical protein